MIYQASKTTWLNPNIEYLFDSEIIEYDMSDAGFSLVKEFHLLSDDEIERLTLMGKGVDRHIAIGNLQRNNKQFSNELLRCFTELRKFFIDYNNLDDSKIISVKKDAFFTIGPCRRTKFGSIKFAEKNRYTSYLRLTNINDVEIYYSSAKLDVKGITAPALNRHRLYMLEFISKMMGMIEAKDPHVKRYLIKFIDEYKAHDLDDAYYLEFNRFSRDIDPIFNFQKLIIPLTQIISRELI